MLKGFQKVNRVRGSELSLGVRWSDSGLELVGNQLNLRGIHFNWFCSLSSRTFLPIPISFISSLLLVFNPHV